MTEKLNSDTVRGNSPFRFRLSNKMLHNCISTDTVHTGNERDFGLR